MIRYSPDFAPFDVPECAGLRLAGVSDASELGRRPPFTRGHDRATSLGGSIPVRLTPIALSNEMCHNVHMKTISIRELHLKTGRWVRHAASRGPIVVTDRGRRVAALQPFDASMTGRPLPNREAAIRKRSKVPVDSAVYQSELREER